MTRKDELIHLRNPKILQIKNSSSLKLKLEDISKNEVVDTDEYFLTTDDEAIKLHKTALEQAPFGIVTADFPTPATFFPKVLVKGDKWDIVADATILEIPIKSTTNLEIVGF